MDTPYQWTKQIASHWGGTRNGTVVHWPNGIKAKGEIRNQFHHVIDVAPTILEVAGLPAPTFVNGVQQAPHRRRLDGATHSTTRRRRTAHDPVLRDVRQPRHLPPGLDGGHEAQHALGARRSRPSTMTSGSCTGPTTGPRHGTSRPSSPRSSRTPAPVPHRGGEVQRPAARRPARRAIQPGPGRSPATDPRQHADAVRWHGPANRELGHRGQEQVARHHGARSPSPRAAPRA